MHIATEMCKMHTDLSMCSPDCVSWCMQFVIVTDVTLANEVLRSGLDKAPVYKAFDRVSSTVNLCLKKSR